MALFDLFQPILDAIKRALGPFGRMFDLLGRFWTNLKTILPRINTLVGKIRFEITEWRRFKEDLRYRTSVINIPKAIEQITEFISQLARARDAIFDLWTELRQKLQPAGNPTEEAQQAIQDIENSGFRDIVQKFPRLLRGAEKVLGFVAIVTDAFESISGAIDDLVAIVDALRAIRENIERGSAVFLQQNNKRKTVTLEDGTKMKIRVGSLHPT